MEVFVLVVDRLLCSHFFDAGDITLMEEEDEGESFFVDAEAYNNRFFRN
jgi:hypothetical protein